jgi:hypothetical protein
MKKRTDAKPRLRTAAKDPFEPSKPEPVIMVIRFSGRHIEIRPLPRSIASMFNDNNEEDQIVRNTMADWVNKKPKPGAVLDLKKHGMLMVVSDYTTAEIRESYISRVSKVDLDELGMRRESPEMFDDDDEEGRLEPEPPPRRRIQPRRHSD